MSLSLVRAGFEVHACDVHAEAVQKVVDAGGVRRITGGNGPARRRADHRRSHRRPDRNRTVRRKRTAPRLKPGSVVIASATVSPDFAKALGKRLEALGLLMIDGPISGEARPRPWPAK